MYLRYLLLIIQTKTVLLVHTLMYAAVLSASNISTLNFRRSAITGSFKCIDDVFLFNLLSICISKISFMETQTAHNVYTNLDVN